MGLVVIEPATVDVVSLEEAKAHMNVTSSGDDEVIARLIATAVGHLAGARGTLGRFLAPTRLRLTLSAFLDAIELPFPPAVSVEAVSYTSPTGVEVAIPMSDLRVADLGSDEGAVITRRHGLAWPWVAAGPSAVRVDFTAGYEDVPEPLRSAVLMHVAHLYENREASLVGVNAQVLPMGYADLIAPYERWAC